MRLSPRRRRPFRLVLLEDKPKWIEQLQERFTPPEFECEVALTVKTARDIIAERHMDALVVDAAVESIPRGGLGALVEEMKAAAPHTKVIVFNGATAKAMQRRVRRLGADGYLSKRSDLKALERSVRRIMDGAV